MQASKVIIAIDGNVYSGKTTVLKSTGEYFLKEHNHFVIPLEKVEDFWAIHRRYVESELKRAECELASVTYLDRSVFSLAAHTYILYHVYGKDCRKEFMELISSDKYKIVWPMRLLVLRRRYLSSLLSYLYGKLVNDKKNTPFIFISPRYFFMANRFYGRISESLPGVDFISYCTTAKAAKIVKSYSHREGQFSRDMILSVLRDVLHDK